MHQPTGALQPHQHLIILAGHLKYGADFAAQGLHTARLHIAIKIQHKQARRQLVFGARLLLLLGFPLLLFLFFLQGLFTLGFWQDFRFQGIFQVIKFIIEMAHLQFTILIPLVLAARRRSSNATDNKQQGNHHGYHFGQKHAVFRKKRDHGLPA